MFNTYAESLKPQIEKSFIYHTHRRRTDKYMCMQHHICRWHIALTLWWLYTGIQNNVHNIHSTDTRYVRMNSRCMFANMWYIYIIRCALISIAGWKVYCVLYIRSCWVVCTLLRFSPNQFTVKLNRNIFIHMYMYVCICIFSKINKRIFCMCVNLRDLIIIVE